MAGAVALSAPVDLAASVRALDQRRANRMYLRRLIASLVRKVKAKATHFPARIDASLTKNIHGFGDFDGRFTAPLHGFRDAEDYWSKCSSRQFLSAINVPTLVLSAKDDPFLTPDCLPFAEAESNARLFLEVTETGGHLGFFHSLAGHQTWAEQRITEFLTRSIDFEVKPTCRHRP